MRTPLFIVSFALLLATACAPDVGSSSDAFSSISEGDDGRLLSLAGADYIGDACGTGGSGTCLDDRFDGCNSGYLSGLCGGPANIRCCMDSEPAGTAQPSVSEFVGTACGGADEGTCLDDRFDSCQSGFVSGLCAGPAAVRCCFDDSLSGDGNGAETNDAARSSQPVAPSREVTPRSTVPYFYQFANQLSPAATCQNTSLAMVLSYLGWNGRPDDITREFGRRLAQSPAGLAGLFNQLARRNGIGGRLEPYTSGSIDQLHQALRNGPVIVHGYFTRAGHVVVALGYDGNGYRVHDPAGRWNEQFRGGYGGGSSAGRDVYYSKAAFERAIATSDGYSYLPAWFHALRR